MNQICISQQLFLRFIFPSNLPLFDITVHIDLSPGISLGRMELICSLCPSRKSNVAGQLLDLWTDLFFISGKSMSFWL